MKKKNIKKLEFDSQILKIQESVTKAAELIANLRSENSLLIIENEKLKLENKVLKSENDNYKNKIKIAKFVTPVLRNTGNATKLNRIINQSIDEIDRLLALLGDNPIEPSHVETTDEAKA